MLRTGSDNVKAFDAGGWRIGIVVAQFNRSIADKLYQNTLARAKDYELKTDNIHTVRVAGSVEIPLVLSAMATSGRYQALVALGCVIKGETAHFDYVCKFITEGVLRVQLDHKVPVAFGVLTCDTETQAIARTHLGKDYLDAVMHQARAIADMDALER